MVSNRPLFLYIYIIMKPWTTTKHLANQQYLATVLLSLIVFVQTDNNLQDLWWSWKKNISLMTFAILGRRSLGVSVLFALGCCVVWTGFGWSWSGSWTSFSARMFVLCFCSMTIKQDCMLCVMMSVSVGLWRQVCAHPKQRCKQVLLSTEVFTSW